MSEMKLFEQIEDYLMDRLSRAERNAFESEMAANPVLKEEVKLHRDMMQAIEEQEKERMEEPPAKDVLALRELLEKSYQAFQQEKNEELPKPQSGSAWKRLLLVAAALLLIALGIWWTQRQPATEIGKQLPVPADTLQTLPQQQEPIAQTTMPPTKNLPESALSPAQNYAALAQDAYADSPFDAGTLMGEGEEADESPLQKASEAYAKKQYRETTTLLQNLPEEGRTEALKLRAHSQFQLKRYDRATSDFEELTKSISYRNDAEWYLLLCYAARLPKTKVAFDSLLSKVTAAGHPFEQKAKKLKAQVEELIDD